MNKTFHLQVLTPEEVVFDDQITSLIAPGSDGYLGILVNHASLITTLIPGRFLITDKNEEKLYFHVGEGFLEVNNNECSLLIETLEHSEPFDMGSGI